jgi:ABC-type oligopeptide transport system substrate-binding subunit
MEVFHMPGRKHSRVGLLLALFCVLAMLVAACGGTSPLPTGKLVPAPPDQQVLRFPIGATDFGSLDPALATVSTDIFAVQTIFTGLVELRGDGTVMDQMATSHEMSADGLSYTFHLRPNLTFSDGTPLTTQDIAYSINRTLQPATKSPLASFLSAMKDFDKIIAGKTNSLIGDSILVPDDHTLTIVLTSPTPSFLASFAFPITFPVNRKLIEKYGTSWTDHLGEGAGDGPFQAASYQHNTGLTVVPNPRYYGVKPRLQKIELLRSGKPDTTYAAYQANQIDLAAVPGSHVELAKKRKDFKQAPALQITYLTMNYLAKPFDNIKIRQAFALALDKDVLAQRVLHDTVLPTNHLMPDGMPGFNKALTGPGGVSSTQGDVTKARQLLQEGMQEEGYSSISQMPSITLAYFILDSDTANLITVLAQRWQTVLGVTVRPNLMAIDVLLQQMTNSTGQTGPLQMWFLSYGGIADPEQWLSIIFGKGATFNNMNYGQNNSSDAAEQQAVQAELAVADSNLNPQQRTQQYNDAEQKLVNDVSWIPLFQVKQSLVVNPKLQNFPIYPISIIPPDEWGKIYFVQ